MNTIVFAINDTFAPYLYVCLKSLSDNKLATSVYKIYVLTLRLSDAHRHNILHLQLANMKIEFINVNDFISEQDFYINDYFSIETYFRFFLPRIFPKLDKVLYLDADTMVMADIAPLFNIDIEQYYLAATHDYEVIRLHNTNPNDYDEYITNVLHLDAEHYFQAGCMLINLKKMRQNDITRKLLVQLQRFKQPKFVDQDILNVVCGDAVKYIPANWNFTWHLPIMDFQYKKHLPEKHLKSYTNAMRNPFIIHFSGIKPFDCQNLNYTDLFMEYTRGTPYETWAIKKVYTSHKKHLRQLKTLSRKLFKYHVFKFLTFGLSNKKYDAKIRNRQNDIKRIYKYAIKNHQ